MRFVAILVSFSWSVGLHAQTALYAPNSGAVGSSSTANVGIGTSNPAGRLTVETDSAGMSEPDAPLVVRGATNTAESLSFGFQTTSNFGWIQAVDYGVSVRSLALQPNGGSVGIGTTNPVGVLSIASNAASNNQYIRFENSESGHARIWNLGMATAASGAFVLNDLTAGAERVRVSHAGNVGIGIASPAVRFDVAADGTQDNVAYFRSRRTYTYLSLVAGANDDSSAEFAFERTGVNAGNLLLGGYANGNIVFRNTGYLPRMVITSTGDVGIGTTSPSHKLAVNGTIRAKEIIVDTAWADFVFDPDYRLAPLSEVEAHIREKRHLPGLPSEATVAKEGVSLGEMQKLLLQKIEELTLHQISQEKRLNEQAGRIRRLEAENDVLRNL